MASIKFTATMEEYSGKSSSSFQMSHRCSRESSKLSYVYQKQNNLSETLKCLT